MFFSDMVHLFKFVSVFTIYTQETHQFMQSCVYFFLFSASFLKFFGHLLWFYLS